MRISRHNDRRLIIMPLLSQITIPLRRIPVECANGKTFVQTAYEDCIDAAEVIF
jgi:hypothetical protein